MRSAILILCVGLVAACSGQTTAPGTGSSSQAPASQGGQPQATPQASVAAGGSGTAIVHVEVLGGKLAGTYDATSAKYDCNNTPRGSGATYLDTTVTKGLSGVTFVTIVGGASPATFTFQADFADPAAGLLQQPSLVIDLIQPSSAKGHGTAKLEDKGATIKWTVDGATADGIGLKGSIECGPVDRR
ncbi:MAG: hypothetical protein M3067_13655 [Chloroflexota bacterium]|nr:hypothetical protein [Chloroflexota bacterium]